MGGESVRYDALARNGAGGVGKYPRLLAVTVGRGHDRSVGGYGLAIR